jgi:hypothetical protein|nr:MAG TPA: hypothetical protein [Caudoviricetes sp.]
MLQEKEALAALDRLEAGYNGAGKVTALFSPVRAAVTGYFKPGDEKLTASVQYTIHQLALDIMNRETVYEHQELLPSPSMNFPLGYTIVRELFTGGGALTEIYCISGREFNRGYQELDPTGLLPPKSNTYLTKWEELLSTARAGELSALGAVASFCESGSYNAGLSMLFENLGGIVASIGKEELAKEIYLDCGYLDVIRTFGLDVHIPTCIKEGHG